MVICFDLRALQIGHENRGIGMYIRSLLENIDMGGNECYFYIFNKNDPIKDLNIKLNFDYKLVVTPTIKTALGSPRDIWGLVKLVNHSFKGLKPLSPDVFVQFDFMLGIPRWRGVKTVVIGYDLIPLIKKNEYLPNVVFAWQHTAGKKAKLRAVARSIYYRIRYRLHYMVFRRASEIICISESTAKSFADILRIPADKLHTVPLAPVFSTTKPDDSIVQSIKKPYILYVGGTDSRKRLQDIVKAFNIARGRGADLRLVLAGNEFKELNHVPSIEGRNAILDSPYKKDIILIGFVSDAQKIALYAAAHAFIFCSTYEGFGLPVIEAMSAGCPVISYNNSSIPEAAGDAALLVDTGDYVAVANKILELFDESPRHTVTQKGLAQSKKFSWRSCTSAFMKVLLRI